MDGTKRKHPRVLEATPWAALGLALALLAGCARTGAIQGRIRIAGQPAPADAVVLAWRETDERATPSGDRIRILHSRGRFVPRLVVVPPGTTLEFENRDRVYHNVFSVSPAARFDLGGIAPGQVRERVFDRQGVVHVYCELHPKEAAWVVVAPEHFSTQAAADGAFAFEKVPPGTYLVRAFHPALGDVTRRVKVEPKKTAVLRLGS
jgi:plastocyanin